MLKPIIFFYKPLIKSFLQGTMCEELQSQKLKLLVEFHGGKTEFHFCKKEYLILLPEYQIDLIITT